MRESVRLGAAACAVCLASVIWPEVAAAARLVTMVRGTGAGSEGPASFVAHFIRRAFVGDRRYEVVELASLLDDPARLAAQQDFTYAAELTAQGREAYETLELDAAVELLNTALSKYERHAGYVSDMAQVANVLMLAAATHILRGEEEAGVQRIEQALAVHPRVQPDPRIFNPSMRETFDSVVQRVTARTQVKLTLTSNPSYAEVYVDGGFVGVTPVEVTVPTGRHYVRFYKEGYSAWGQAMDIGEAGAQPEPATLTPTQTFDEFDILLETALIDIEGRWQGPDRSLPDSVRQLGKLLNVDEVFMVEVRLDGEQVVVQAHQFQLNKDRRLKSATHSFPFGKAPRDYDPEIEHFIEQHFSEETLFVDPLRPKADGALGVTEEPPACFGFTCSDFRQYSLVLGIGGGAALMAGGVTLWALATKDVADFVEAPQESPLARSLRSNGKTKALAGDILFFAGLGLAGAGAYGYFFYEPPEETAVPAAPKGSAGVVLLPGAVTFLGTF